MRSWCSLSAYKMRCNVRKPPSNMSSQRRSACAFRSVWSESSIGAFCIANDAQFRHADNADSDQTARLCGLIWVYVEHRYQKVRFFTLRLKSLTLKNTSLNREPDDTVEYITLASLFSYVCPNNKYISRDESTYAPPKTQISLRIRSV